MENNNQFQVAIPPEWIIDMPEGFWYLVHEMTWMTPYDECVVYLLAKAYQRAHAIAKRRLLPYGLTPVQQLVLAALGEEDGISSSDLGKKVSMDPATLSGMLDRMVEGGWITKESDLDDKRFLRICLTEQARAQLPNITQERHNVNDEILQNLSLEEKVLLKRLLKDLRE